LAKNLVIFGLRTFLLHNYLILLRGILFCLERVQLFRARTAKDLVVLGLQRLGPLYIFVGLLISLIKLVFLLVATKDITILMFILYLIGLVSLLLEVLLLNLNTLFIPLSKRVEFIATQAFKNSAIFRLQSQSSLHALQLRLVFLVELIVVVGSFENFAVLVFGLYLVRLIFLLLIGLLVMLRVALAFFPRILDVPKLILVSNNFVVLWLYDSSGGELLDCVWLVETLLNVLVFGEYLVVLWFG